MRKQRLRIVEMIPFKSFKEKIRLTKKYEKCRVEVISNYLYIERWKYE